MFEIKARVKWGWITLAEFDSEESAKTWIEIKCPPGGVELWVKENGEWVKR